MRRIEELAPPMDLPLHPPGRSVAFSGVLLLVTIELAVFVSFVVSYFYLRMGIPLWPPPDAGMPKLLVSGAGQGLLTLSALPMLLAERHFRRDRPRTLRWAIPAGLLFVGGYVALKIVELLGVSYHWASHAYGSINWTLSAYQLLHIVGLGGFALLVWGFAVRGALEGQRKTAVEAVGLYWYFVVASSWLAWLTTHLSPYVL